MKTLYALAAAALLLSAHNISIASAHPTAGSAPAPLPCEGTIILASQADVDAFPTTYGCSVINGNLLVSGPDIVNLDGLDSVTRINGGLTLDSNPGLVTGAGLRQLQFVGHDPVNPDFAGLKVINNPNLQSMFDMVSLREVDGSFRVENNPRMSSMSSIGWVETIGAEPTTGLSIVIDNNPLMFEIDDFRALTTVNGIIQISNNNNLQEIEFASLTEVSGTSAGFIIDNNKVLVELSGLSHLTSITGEHAQLTITNNAWLPNVAGLRSLTTVEGTSSSKIEISGNASITEVRGLNAVTSFRTNQSLIVTDNPKLTEGCGFYTMLSNWDNSGSITYSNNGAAFTRESILAGGPCPKVCYSDITLTSQAEVDAFPGCGQVTGTILITGADIINLDSLYTLQRIDGSLVIVDNPMLADISGLSALTHVGGNGYGAYPGLHITNNPQLTSLDGLNRLTTNGGILIIQNNARLENIDGLSSLAKVGAPYPSGTSVVLTQNPVLKNIHGFRSITYLGGDLSITYNDSLKDLHGLDSLTHVGGSEGGSLEIANNQSLESLHGLDALESLEGRATWLDIEHNPKLLNLDGLEKLRTFGGPPPTAITVAHNASLRHADALSGITLLYTPDPRLYVVDNPNLTRGCGFYGMVANPAVDVEISGNGPGVTKEDILANGPCNSSSCTPPLDKDVFAEYPTGNAPHSTNIIVNHYEPGVMYELHKESDNSLVAGPYPGSVGLYVRNLTETTTFYVLAKKDSTCQAVMTKRPTVTIIGSDSTACSGVVIEDKMVVAEQDTLASGQATNIIVFDSDPGIQYLLRNDADNDTLAGPWHSSVGLYTGAVYSTTTYNVVAIDDATGCSMEMSTLVTITVPEENMMVAVYPNPSAGEFVVDVKENSGVSHYSIIDARGSVIRSERLNGSSMTSIDLKPAVPGIYYLSVYRTNGSVESKRLVIR
jgi:hypothetical protein